MVTSNDLAAINSSVACFDIFLSFASENYSTCRYSLLVSSGEEMLTTSVYK